MKRPALAALPLPLPLSYKKNFRFQIKTPFVLNPPLYFVNKGFNVTGCGTSCVDDNIAVPGGYLCAAHT